MAQTQVDKFLFGAAYYDEYILPHNLERIDKDFEMMREAGMNVIRIAEFTWSTEEPEPGVFNFAHVDRALEAAQKYNIKVIIGTPTAAVPSWLVELDPHVLAVQDGSGQAKYGARQNMDIVNGTYRFYAERIIRKLISHTASHPQVIGFQVDNETKYYDSCSPDMQKLFVQSLRKRFHNSTDELNRAFGLDYWSNRVDAWDNFPDVSGSINQSLRGAFDEFRRGVVTEFLAWQASIVREYMRDDQFITQNFDYEWRGYSYGVQPAVNHFEAGKALDISGVDIYHPTEEHLTGKEIGFGGDVARSVKDGRNFIVLETEAQGQHGWLPYAGQLRLQAYSHVANGADGVMYWHWHSIHNSFETYWKGVLSHDFEKNPTYEEAGIFGREMQSDEIGGRLLHGKKNNRVAIMVSNEALSALNWFNIESGFPFGGNTQYNDVVRRFYDALFELNVETDIIPVNAELERIARYDMVLTPALYVAPQNTIDNLREYVAQGGHLVSTLRSFVTDENTKVWQDRAPHDLTDVFGVTYNQFTRPDGVVTVSGSVAETFNAEALIELLKATDDDVEVLGSYDHYAWDSYAAVTRHSFGKGDAQYIATLPSAQATREILREAIEHAGITSVGLPLSGQVSVRQTVTPEGKTATYLFNYSAESVTFTSPVSGEVLVAPEIIGQDGKLAGEKAPLAKGSVIVQGDEITIGRWNVAVILG
ncbi:beta-galactosidase [Alloscardovia theropitheci]|uniref:beta-galactosidase n=1 Tax=Alloscardovia theropitheci TaxID=2496842 RepID=A0A4R0QPL2_9BIFI|nr:beta-galactosidase [Alloscardovia theropitheci]TCD54172.1 beta-galactosidase [Alloscardovia theropitheci]